MTATGNSDHRSREAPEPTASVVPARRAGLTGLLGPALAGLVLGVAAMGFHFSLPGMGDLHAVAAASFRAPLPSPASLRTDQELTREQATTELGARVVFDRVRKGDTLSSLFKRQNVAVQTALELVNDIRGAFNLAKRLKPGRPIKFALTEDRDLTALAYPVGQRKTLRVTRRNDGSFMARILPEPFARTSLYAYLNNGGKNQEGEAEGRRALASAAVASTELSGREARMLSSQELRQVTTRVRPGDSLSSLLQRHKVSMRTSMALAASAKPHFDLDQHLQPGKNVEMVFDPKHRLVAFSYPTSDEQIIRLTSRQGLRFNVALLKPEKGEEGASDPVSAEPAETTPDDDLAALDEGELLEPAPFVNAANLVVETVRRGDNLAQLLSRRNVPVGTTLSMAKAAKPVFDLARNLKPGKKLRLAFNAENRLLGLEYPLDTYRTFWLTRGDVMAGFTPRIAEKKLLTRHNVLGGIIDGSFYMAARKAGLTRSQSMDLIKLFEWDVDLAKDIHTGDRFQVVVENYYHNGRQVREGEILSAELINKGKRHRAVYYEDPDGNGGYYDEKGLPVNQMLIRAPVDFTRISSHFSNKRKHPIFGYTRAHKGVDYAAPRGTPIRAAGDGVITFIGRKGSFGKLILIRHNSKYTTAYAHMSRYARGMKKGKKIRQGEVIGRVGTTGAATGPHLHYEVRVYNKAINPLSVRIPAGDKVPSRYLADFRRKIKPLMNMMDKGPTAVAHLKSGH